MTPACFAMLKWRQAMADKKPGLDQAEVIKMTEPNTYDRICLVNLKAAAAGSFSGFRIYTSTRLVKYVDFPRSLGRSARRRLMGHRQHFVTLPSPDVVRLGSDGLVMHPDTYETMRAACTLQPCGLDVGGGRKHG